nr:PREDICTED: uncharacterized protein LOC103544760 [Equus przewalskii]
MVLCPVIRKLLHKRVVLASASPRRQEILRQAGLRFEVVPSRFKEMLPKALFPSPPAYAVETAKQKALEVARRMHQKDLRAPDVVIGADTIVAVGGLILEKPVDKQDAYSMLSRWVPPHRPPGNRPPRQTEPRGGVDGRSLARGRLEVGGRPAPSDVSRVHSPLPRGSPWGRVAMIPHLPPSPSFSAPRVHLTGSPRAPQHLSFCSGRRGSDTVALCPSWTTDPRAGHPHHLLSWSPHLHHGLPSPPGPGQQMGLRNSRLTAARVWVWVWVLPRSRPPHVDPCAPQRPGPWIP